MRTALLLLIPALFLPVLSLAQTARASSGLHPDLSGTYDITTLTPVIRPANFGDRLTLTDDEARTQAKAMADQVAKRNEASDPNRKAPPAGGDGSSGAAGNVGGYNLWVDIGNSAFQLDGKWRTSIIVDPPNGQLPQMMPEAMKRAAARRGQNRPNRGDAWWITEGVSPGPYDDPELRPYSERCLMAFGQSATTPALPNYMYNNLRQIVQSKDTVVILNEMIHDARIVRINGKHDPPEIRRWLGDSVGHWEGDTLVIDTTNFKDQPALFGADGNLHVIERISRIDAKTLLYHFTIDDPTVWTKPWSGEMPWPATEGRIFEYACHEGNYSFAGILRGARRLEAEAANKK
jgi:hypothetical protein